MIEMKEREEVTMTELEYLRFTTSARAPFTRRVEEGFFRFGEVKPGGNPYAFTEERNCAGHICRKIGNGIYNIHVIRDDGTVWKVNLEYFESVTPLAINIA